MNDKIDVQLSRACGILFNHNYSLSPLMNLPRRIINFCWLLIINKRNLFSFYTMPSALFFSLKKKTETYRQKYRETDLGFFI